MKTSHLHLVTVRSLSRRASASAAFAIIAALSATSLMARTARAQTAGDVVFQLAAGGSTSFNLDGTPISVGITGGLVSLTADDAPCQTGGDGELICGYTIDYINVLLGDFVAGGSTFHDGVLQTTAGVHVYSSNGEMTVPPGTPGAFGALIDGISRFQAQGAPSTVFLTVDIASQQATVSTGFSGTLNGHSVQASLSASAVSPFINLPPIVDAGPDQRVEGRGPYVAVSLNGSATDPQGGSISSAVWLDNGVVVAQDLNAITMLTPGTHALTLQVFDTFGAKGSDSRIMYVAPGSAIGPPGHRLDFIYCSDEYQTCAVGGKKYIAYGANDSYVFMAVNGTFACGNATFGADPAPGIGKACYFANYSLEVGENGTGSAPPSGFDIAYGANGVFNFARVSGNYGCNNATFGDPIPGIGKACYRALPGYNVAAGENGAMNGLNQTSVAYGANGQFIYKVLSGNVTCAYTTFGYDPAPGVAKACYTDFLGPPIASQLQSFDWSGPVLYGSGLDGNYLSISSTGSGTCDDGTFGGNPDIFALKSCYGVIIPP